MSCRLRNSGICTLDIVANYGMFTRLVRNFFMKFCREDIFIYVQIIVCGRVYLVFYKIPFV